jgi:FHA domain
MPVLQFSLVGGHGETALPRGQLMIGRSHSADLLVDDMLVSRQHARLLVSRDALFIEDLGATNGIVVNEVRIRGTTRLQDGDRIIVGTQEFAVRAVLDSEDAPAIAEREAKEERPTYRPPPPISAPAKETRAHETGAHPGFDGADTQRTEKQDGILTMARLADRMITMGRSEAAARLLADHLGGVLAKAKEGRPVPADVLETVGIYGMKLTELTRDGRFLNAAVELHLVCSRPLGEKAVAGLESLIDKVESIDRALLLRYKATLRELEGTLSKGELALVERILKVPTR